MLNDVTEQKLYTFKKTRLQKDVKKQNISNGIFYLKILLQENCYINLPHNLKHREQKLYWEGGVPKER